MDARRSFDIRFEFIIKHVGNNGGFLHRCGEGGPDFAGKCAHDSHESLASCTSGQRRVAEPPSSSRERSGESSGHDAAFGIKLRRGDVRAPLMRKFGVDLVADDGDAMLMRPVDEGLYIL